MQKNKNKNKNFKFLPVKKNILRNSSLDFKKVVEVYLPLHFSMDFKGMFFKCCVDTIMCSFLCICFFHGFIKNSLKI